MATNNAHRITELIIVLSQADKTALGAVRCLPGLQAASDKECIWVRGIIPVNQPDIRIRQLPALHTYRLDEANNLFAPGALTPVGKLPSLTWQPLPEFIPVTLPVSAMPGKVMQRHAVKLLPSLTNTAGNALLTSLDTWKQYAETAPKARLQAIRFAASANNQVLLTGLPLPPLPGKEYVLNHGILLPVGYAFDPPRIITIIAAQLNPLQDAFLLFDTESNWESIPLQNFVTATRSGIRATKGRMHG